jgi:transposase
MRSDQIMEILEAYDLTGSYRAAAKLVGCDHHTVRRYVELRTQGNPRPAQVVKARAIDEHLAKIEEMVENSRGRIRADKVHERLQALGFRGHATLRRLGGVPTYALTDNEKTVTAEHIARIAVRNPLIVDVGRHYGLAVRTCVPADPQTKGGSESTVRIAKADLVPTQANLLEQYRTFGALEVACRADHRGHRLVHCG